MSTRSPARSSSDVEQLLRRTYAEVAARTSVGSGTADGEARVVPIASARSARWRPALTAAAVLMALVAGLVVLAGRDDGAPAGRGTPTHLAPAWIPRSVTPDGDGRLFPLTELVSTDDGYDRLVYATDVASVTLERFHDGTSGDRRGASSSGGERRWAAPDGSEVVVSWSGEVGQAMIDTFVDGLIGADDELWADLIARGGFAPDLGAERALVTFPIDADEPFRVELVGDLHGGIMLRNGPSGFQIPVTACTADVNYDVADLRGRDLEQPGPIGYIVLVPGRRETAAVVDGSDRFDIAVTPLDPVAAVSVGGIVLDDRVLADEPPTVECEEVTP